MTKALRDRDTGKLDPLKILMAAFPIIMLLVTGYLLSRGLIQTPETRAFERNATKTEVLKAVGEAMVEHEEAVADRLEQHEHQDGHPVALERIGRLQQDVAEIKSDVKAQTRVLTRIEAKIDNGHAGGGN